MTTLRVIVASYLVELAIRLIPSGEYAIRLALAEINVLMAGIGLPETEQR